MRKKKVHEGKGKKERKNEMKCGCEEMISVTFLRQRQRKEEHGEKKRNAGRSTIAEKRKLGGS